MIAWLRNLFGRRITHGITVYPYRDGWNVELKGMDAAEASELLAGIAALMADEARTLH